MLAWALRYLVVVMVVGAGFGLIQGADFLEGENFRQPEPETPDEQAAAREEVFNQHVVHAGPNGHFLIEAVVNGEPVDFLVDTGASDVILDPDDARRLGFRDHALAFEQRYRTANGTVRAAPVRLRELRIGQHSLFDVDAAVNEAPIGVSLLGMSFLREFGGYRVAGERLYLYW